MASITFTVDPTAGTTVSEVTGNVTINGIDAQDIMRFEQEYGMSIAEYDRLIALSTQVIPGSAERVRECFWKSASGFYFGTITTAEVEDNCVRVRQYAIDTDGTAWTQNLDELMQPMAIMALAQFVEQHAATRRW